MNWEFSACLTNIDDKRTIDVVKLSCLVLFNHVSSRVHFSGVAPYLSGKIDPAPLKKMARTPMAVAGPSTWNLLPKSLRDPSNSASVFVRLLKTFIFSEYRCIQRIRRFGEDALLYKSTFYITFYNIPGSRHWVDTQMARLKVALMYFIENEMFNDAPLRITLRISTRGEVWAYTLLHVWWP